MTSGSRASSCWARRADSGLSGYCSKWDLALRHDGNEGGSESLRLLELQCTASSAACDDLGRVFMSRGQANLAMERFLKACDAGIDESCFNASRVVMNGAKGAPQDLDAAWTFLDGACVRGHLASCFNQTWMAGQGMHPADAGWVRASFFDLCERGLMAGCSSAGYQAEKGLGGPVDLEAAQRAYTTACDGNDGTACNNLGVMVRDAKVEPARATALMKRACELGEDYGCGGWGQDLVEGRAGPLDLDAGIPLLERGCTAGDGESCFVLAHALGKSSRTGALIKQACAQGHQPACARNRGPK